MAFAQFRLMSEKHLAPRIGTCPILTRKRAKAHGYPACYLPGRLASILFNRVGRRSVNLRWRSLARTGFIYQAACGQWQSPWIRWSRRNWKAPASPYQG